MKYDRLAMVLLALIACAAVGAAPDGNGAKDNDEPTTKQSREPEMTLLDAGAEPRMTLRLRPVLGASSRVEFVTRTHLTRRIDELSFPPAKLPAMHFGAQLTIEGRDDNGDYSCVLHYDKATLQPERDTDETALKQMQEMIKWMDGAIGRASISNRGAVSSTSITFPEGAPAMMKAQLESMARLPGEFMVPFPEEPVGVGAQWQVKSVIMQNEAAIDQITTYTLFSLRGGMVGVDVDIKQHADEQKTAARDGSRLKSVTGDGSGRFALNIAEVLPLRANLRLNTDSTVIRNEQDWQQQIDMEMLATTNPIRSAPVRTQDEVDAFGE